MFRTELPLEPADFSLSYTDKAMAMGSCFAENIGQQLERLKYPVSVNPFGPLYNPVSIRNSLALLLNQYRFAESDLFQHQDLWHSFQHHGRFSGLDPAAVAGGINGALDAARAMLPQLDLLMLTFGTAWVYELKSSGQVVSNCHKLPEHYFRRRRLEIADIVDSYEPLLEYLYQINPRLRVVLTVSPIRHLKETLPGNQASKSILLLSAHELSERLPFVEYFPAYELMLDDLRDYRFYAEDLVHPSALAIEYIWQKFEARYLSERDKILRQRLEKLQRGLEHRPQNPGAPSHRFFLERQLNAMADLVREFPFLDFAEEQARIRQQLQA
jgi:hypothetical protein